MITIQENGDGTATVLAPSMHPCPTCFRVTRQLDECLLCQKGAVTSA